VYDELAKPADKRSAGGWIVRAVASRLCRAKIYIYIYIYIGQLGFCPRVSSGNSGSSSTVRRVGYVSRPAQRSWAVQRTLLKAGCAGQWRPQRVCFVGHITRRSHEPPTTRWPRQQTSSAQDRPERLSRGALGCPLLMLNGLYAEVDVAEHLQTIWCQHAYGGCWLAASPWFVGRSYTGGNRQQRTAEGHYRQ
jgi:hypothetical protein